MWMGVWNVWKSTEVCVWNCVWVCVGVGVHVYVCGGAEMCTRVRPWECIFFSCHPLPPRPLSPPYAYFVDFQYPKYGYWKPTCTILYTVYTLHCAFSYTCTHSGDRYCTSIHTTYAYIPIVKSSPAEGKSTGSLSDPSRSRPSFDEWSVMSAIYGTNASMQAADKSIR
jgi:hypothetical protein